MINGILQKKKFIKTIVLAFLSLFVVVQPYITRVHALTNVITYNNYGSFEIAHRGTIAGSSQIYMRAEITGNLNQYYTGTLKLNFSGYNSVNYGVVLSEGTYISDYGTNYIQLTLQGVNYFSLSLVSTQAFINQLVFNSFSNWNLTRVGAYSEIQEVHRIKLDVSGILIDVGNIADDVDTINANIGTIINKLDQINVSINNASTIKWHTYTPRIYSASTDNLIYSNNDITSNVKDIYVRFAPVQQDANYIYRIDTGVSSNNYLASMNVVSVSGISNSNYTTFTPKYYIDRSGRNLVIYIYDTLLNANNDSRYIIIHLNGGEYYLRYRNELFNIKMLPDTDVNYWNLLNVFEKTNVNVDMSGLTVQVTPEIPYNQEVTNDTVNNIDISNEIYTDIHDIETNFLVDIETQNESITLPDVPSNQFIQGANSFYTNMDNLLIRIPIVKTLIIYMLVCGTLLILLGV